MGLALGFHPFQRSHVGASPVQRSYQGTARLQIAGAAISIAKPINFNFVHNTLSNGKIPTNDHSANPYSGWQRNTIYSFWALSGTSKIALGIQCHVNCLGGSQILLQRKNGSLKSRRYTSVVKKKQGKQGKNDENLTFSYKCWEYCFSHPFQQTPTNNERKKIKYK